MPHRPIIFNGEVWPSVTEVINFWDDAHPKPWIIAWKKKYGEKKCNEIRDKAARIGSCFHKAIETKKMPKWKRVADMYKVFLAWDIQNYYIKEIMIEKTVIHKELKYGGTFDRYSFPRISDWKTKPKPEYKNVAIQLKAYAMALETEIDEEIIEGELVNVSRIPPHILTHLVFDLTNPIYEKEWLKRLEFYYKNKDIKC